jgi:hypothetical protein
VGGCMCVEMLNRNLESKDGDWRNHRQFTNEIALEDGCIYTSSIFPSPPPPSNSYLYTVVFPSPLLIWTVLYCAFLSLHKD